MLDLLQPACRSPVRNYRRKTTRLLAPRGSNGPFAQPYRAPVTVKFGSERRGGREFVGTGVDPSRASLAHRGGGTVPPMRDLLLAIHLLVTVAKLLRPGGVRTVAAKPSCSSSKWSSGIALAVAPDQRTGGMFCALNSARSRTHMSRTFSRDQQLLRCLKRPFIFHRVLFFVEPLPVSTCGPSGALMQPGVSHGTYTKPFDGNGSLSRPR
jgi:hypothetical protein